MEAAGSSKHGHSSAILHGATSYKPVIFIVTAIRTSHLARDRLQAWLLDNPHNVETQKEAEEDNKKIGLLEGASYDSKGCQPCSFNIPS